MLGDFIEFEAIAPPDSALSSEESQIRGLRDAFGIANADLIDVSYCDLALNAFGAAGGYQRAAEPGDD